jgi:hypothetical protein
LALRGVGPESEAESVRFRGHRVTKVGPEVKHVLSQVAAHNSSISDPQQVLPLAKVALKAYALGHLKRRDDAPLDLLAGFSGALASRAVFPARPVEMSREVVVLAGLKFGQQLLDDLLHLGESLDERLAVPHRVISRYKL